MTGILGQPENSNKGCRTKRGGGMWGYKPWTQTVPSAQPKFIIFNS
nr:hypothetical protein [Bacteroidota bacterium]